jgi:hypothetical protein
MNTDERGCPGETRQSASGIRPSHEASDFAKAMTDKTADKLPRFTHVNIPIRVHLRNPRLKTRRFF